MVTVEGFDGAHRGTKYEEVLYEEGIEAAMRGDAGCAGGAVGGAEHRVGRELAMAGSGLSAD